MSDSDLPGDPEPEIEAEPLLPGGTEAPAWVGELLAGLRADDPPLPDDVAERVDRALAVLTPADVLPAETEPSGAGTSDDAGVASPPAPGAAGPQRGGATVVPIAARDRRAGSPNPWGHRLVLGGVAAAAALVLGGLGTVAVIRNSGNGLDQGATSADSAELGAGGDRVRYVASSEDYTAATLETTAQAVLAASTTPLGSVPPVTPSLAPGEGSSPGSQGPSPSSGPPTGTASGSAAPSQSALRTIVLRAAAQRPDESCVDSLAGAKDIDPLLVDEATYEHRPAFVVVIGTTDDPGSADVWVVARTCTAGNEGMLAFARIAR